MSEGAVTLLTFLEFFPRNYIIGAHNFLANSHDGISNMILRANSFLRWFHFPRHHCQCHAFFSAILIGLPDCITFSKDLGTSLRLCADDGRLQLFNLFHQIV